MYQIVRTDTADEGLRKIILYVAENFGNAVALEKLDEIEAGIKGLADNPYLGVVPRYAVLRRKSYRVLILEKDLVFYKIDETKQMITIYAITDQRQDYLSIIRGM